MLQCLAILALVAISIVADNRPALANASDEYLERAQEYFEKREYQASIIELKNALQNDRNKVDARLLLGRIYIETGNGAAAEKELGQARELGATLEELPALIARAQLLQGKFQETLQGIAIEDSTSPTNKAVFLALWGEAQFGLGNIDDAKASFTEAVGHDPRNADAHVGLGQLALQARAFDIAEAELAKATSADPNARNVLSLRGDLYFAKGAFAQAESAYQQLADAYPFLPHLLRLAYARAALGKNNEAIADIEQILRAAPRHPGANYLRALTAFQTQDYETAKFHIDQALNSAPLTPQYQFLAGATNYALGFNEQALRFLERYVARAFRAISRDPARQSGCAGPARGGSTWAGTNRGGNRRSRTGVGAGSKPRPGDHR
jgi:putative PEP-CTERM system TPR-repeat lipoprotein